MKIGIVSDSHKKLTLLDDALKRLKEDGAQYIIHAGDIVLKEALDRLEKCGLPYWAVFGNNDHDLFENASKYNIDKEPSYFKIEDISIKLMHLPYYLNPDTQMVVYGHTHYFKCEMQNGTLFINPGEICARKKPISEFAMVEINDKVWSVMHYQRDMQKDNAKYSLEKFEFKKAESQ